MPDQLSMAGIGQRLDGGACLNQRTILNACEVFFPTEHTDAPLTVSRLLEALWFLELSVVSCNISYDGTLPTSDLISLDRRIERLHKVADFPPDFFRKTTPETENDWFNLMYAGAASALNDVTSVGDVAFEGLDTPFAASEAGTFFSLVKELHGEAQADSHGLVDPERVQQVAALQTRGAKCVAGIAAVGEEALRRALELAETTTGGSGLAMAVLVNRFRFSYVRQLAFGARDVYVPGSAWKRLSEFHAVTFAEVVRAHFAKEMGGRLSADLEQRIDAGLGGSDRRFSVALPPIGLYALMAVHPTDTPAHVVNMARETFAEYGALFRSFWSTTREIEHPEDGYTAKVSQRDMDEVHGQIERLLTDTLGRLQRRSRGEFMSPMERFLTPVMRYESGVAAVASSVTRGLLSDGLKDWGQGLAVIGSAIVGQGVASFLAHAADKLNAALTGHVDDYRNLERSLGLEVGSLTFKRLADRVEAVFGRKLVV